MISPVDLNFLKRALQLARRGYGATSPNPMVGAVLVKDGRVIGSGWHKRAGLPHAEIEALEDARRKKFSPRGSTLYVTLEPCCTHGRTPPCTESIRAAAIRRVVVGATDPNPRHAGRGFLELKEAGIEVETLESASQPIDCSTSKTLPEDRSVLELAKECRKLNEAFNHWIVHCTPFVTVKAAMTLDGKIATATGESKWITGATARGYGMRLRQGADAILVGIKTVQADNPSLTCRGLKKTADLRRIILDSMARTPVGATVAADASSELTTVIVSARAPKVRVKKLSSRVNVIMAPVVVSASGNRRPAIDLRWVLERLGAENVVNLLVEGGGEVNASFIFSGLVNRLALFYAPRILGGRQSQKAVAGVGAERSSEAVRLHDIEWSRLGDDLFLTARTGMV